MLSTGMGKANPAGVRRGLKRAMMVRGLRSGSAAVRPFDVLLQLTGKLRVFAGPFAEGGRQIAPHLAKITPVVHPAQIEQGIVVDLSWRTGFAADTTSVV
ncbi:hypothetical protein ACVWXO_000206 [Bradyrhizobium sp. LM2.7]|jgi:hypothetical protein